jgi:hypothetical protein
MARKPTDYVQFKLRIRESLRRRIEKAAAKKKVSANAEAIERIEKTFVQDEGQPAMIEMLKKMQDFQYEAEIATKTASELFERDSRVLNALVAKDENARLLRLMILDLGKNPEWAATPESRKAFADKIHEFLVSGDFEEEAPAFPELVERKSLGRRFITDLELVPKYNEKGELVGQMREKGDKS